MTTRRVTWRRTDDPETDEHATLSVRGAGLSLVGTVLGADGGVPIRIEYRLLVDGTGLTSAAHVRDLRGFEQRTVAIERSEKGAWSVNGAAARGLKGCTDVDLAFSPSTGALPIRRLRLGIGASQRVRAARVEYPELTVTAIEQTYRRLDEYTYQRESGPLTAELVVDDEGVIASGGPWRRTGVAVGPEDTDPLDGAR